MEDKISVIVTTYNQEDTIGRTLNSILAQKCHLPIEIIIGEDCSTDNTRSVCEDYAQRYPHIIRLMPKAENKGIQNNYYDCLLECKGKYIADCAGDDFWIDDKKLEKEVCIMEEDPSVTLVHTNWQYYEEKTQKTKRTPFTPSTAYKKSGKNLLEAIVTQTKAPVIHTCTSLYRAETIRECYIEDPELFRNKDYGCEDLQLTFMLAMKGKVVYIPDVTLNYSVGHNSITFQPNERRQFLFVRQTTSLSYHLARIYNIDTPRTKEFFSGKVFALYMHAFRSKDKTLRDEAYKYRKTWNVVENKKIKVARLIMSNNLIWNSALLSRKLFCTLKLFTQLFK